MGQELQEEENMQEEEKMQGEEYFQRNRCNWIRRFYIGFQRCCTMMAAVVNTKAVRAIVFMLKMSGAILLCSGVVYIFMFGFSSSVRSLKKPTNKHPVIVWATFSYLSYPPGDTLKCFHEGKYLECELGSQDYKPVGGIDAYFFYATFFKALPLPRDPNVLWAIIHEESPRNNLKIMNERGLNLFNFSATYSTNSDVPMPLINMKKLGHITEMKFFVKTSVKNNLLSELAPVMYMQSNCRTSTDRDDYVSELMRYIKVDSYGACLHNKDLPLPSQFQPLTWSREYLKQMDRQSYLRFLARYKFVIAIENGVCYDYMTEKLWRPLRLGVVPIYLGAGNVRDWLPHPRAALLLEDYPTPALMAERLHELNNNDTLYELYLDHKIKQRIQNQRLVEEAQIRSYQFDFLKVVKRLACKVCERLHENSTRVNIVTKEHYNCPEPISAMTLSVNPNNEWRVAGRVEEENVEELYSRIYEQRETKNTTELFYGFHNLPY